ncbi:hypothetical protein RYX36_007234, partial [Vicia faba]
TISQIKTIYAFVGEGLAVKSFTENMDKQYVISKGEALVKGVGTGMFQIIYAAPDLQIFNQAKAKVFQVIQRKPLIHNESKRNIHTKISSYIELQDVHFSYPSRPEKYILQGLFLSIPAGKTVALVGSSGCRKSTAISLVTRFYDPTRG